MSEKKIKSLAVVTALSLGAAPCILPASSISLAAEADLGLQEETLEDSSSGSGQADGPSGDNTEGGTEETGVDSQEEGTDDFISVGQEDGQDGSDEDEAQAETGSRQTMSSSSQSALSSSGSADEESSLDIQFTWQNPAGAGDTGQKGSGSSLIEAGDEYYETAIENAAEGLKEALEGYKSSIEIRFDADILDEVSVSGEDYEKYAGYVDGSLEEDDAPAVRLLYEVLQAACSHTGEADEGDFLFFNFHSAECALTEEDGMAVLTLSSVKYLMLDDGVEKVAEAAESLLAADGNPGTSGTSYEWAKYIYDYLHDTLSFSEDGTPSAADALSEDASSYGYAALGYYLLNSAGVDARIITGNGQAWLIADMGGVYYILDPASDADSTGSYSFFLCGSSSHTGDPDWQYGTEQFQAEYPVSEDDYVLSSVTLDKTGVKLAVGEKVSLKAQSSGGGTLRYSSSDESVAKVSSNGQIEGVSAGNATITVSDGEGTAECSVYVAGEHTLDVSVQDDVTGNVSGSGVYLAGDVASITAVRITSDGYLFDHWEFSDDVEFLDGGSAEDYRLSFYMPESDVSAVAVYTKIAVEEIVLDSASLTMDIGDRKTLSYTLLPSNAYEGDVSFKSSNTSVVSVSSGGVLTAKAAGTATITVTSGDASAKCTVTVNGEEYVIQVVGRTSTGVLTTQKKTVTAGKTITISVPDVESYGYVFAGWKSSVSVDYADGYDSDDIKTSIVMPDSDLVMTATYTEVEATSISVTDKSITLDAGDTYDLSDEVTVKPSNALNQDLEYESSDVTVAKVSSEGVITAVSEGTAVITVSCGDVEAEVKVTVEGSGTTTSGTEYLNISVSSLRMYAGSTYTLSVTARNTGTITYKSSNTSVATVSSSGVVTGVAAGTCTITAVSSTGNTSDTVEVTVIERSSSSSSSSSSDSTSDSDSSTALTDDEAEEILASAAKYKADADKIRADAIRAGYVADGSTASGTSSSGSEGADSIGAVSQPTGDPSRLPFWSFLSGASAAGLAALFKAGKKKERGTDR